MAKTKLAKAIALAITGTALSAGAVSTASAGGITMYNTFNTATNGDLGHNLQTDGWTRISDASNPAVNRPANPALGLPAYVNGDGVKTGPESQGNKGDIVPWVGTPAGALPFNYTGSAVLHWAVELQNCGVLQISRQDAIDKYGYSAEIDTGAGAWMDAGTPDDPSTPDVNEYVAPTGWKHQTDIGLLRAQTDLTVTLNLARIGNPSAPGLPNDNFGITIFEGMDDTKSNYSHHGAWNCPDCANPIPLDKSNPWYGAGVGSGMKWLVHDGTVDQTRDLTFNARAGQIYTIALGGAGVGYWRDNISDYALTIKAVPEPATLGLFGVALAAMGAMRRRRDKAVL